MPDRSDTHVALLRGINVGGHNKLPMKDLRSLFEDVGCENVRTYIQSGNIVFDAEDALAARVPQAIGSTINARFGYTIPVVTRTAADLALTVGNNPYTNGDTDERFLAVAFLADAPDATQIASLEHERFAPDRFTVTGGEIFLHYPNGIARSKLTNAYFDRRLDTVTTVRNWRTTRKLLEMSCD